MLWMVVWLRPIIERHWASETTFPGSHAFPPLLTKTPNPNRDSCRETRRIGPANTRLYVYDRRRGDADGRGTVVNRAPVSHIRGREFGSRSTLPVPPLGKGPSEQWRERRRSMAGGYRPHGSNERAGGGDAPSGEAMWQPTGITFGTDAAKRSCSRCAALRDTAIRIFRRRHPARPVIFDEDER